MPRCLHNLHYVTRLKRICQPPETRRILAIVSGLLVFLLILACQPGISDTPASEDNLQAGPVGWPVPVGTQISRGYGCHPFFTGVRGNCPAGWWWHDGIDFAAPAGTPLLAVRDLAIQYAGPDTGSLDCSWIAGSLPPHQGFGLFVKGQDATGLVYWYGHVSRFAATAGQTVRAGEQVASMGSTGCSTSSHLHFRVRRNGLDIDPLEILAQS